MEELSITPVNPVISCASCATIATSNEHFCSTCGYPLMGTEEEKQQFINNREITLIDLEAHQEQVKKAGKTLFWIAGFMVLSGIVSAAMEREAAQFIILFAMVLALIFLGLGFWSRSKPTTAIITGLCVYVLVQLLMAVADPLTIVKGIIFKIIIIGYLIKGIKSSLEADKLLKDHHFPGY